MKVRVVMQALGIAYHALGWVFYFTNKPSAALVCFIISFASTITFLILNRSKS